MIIFLLSAIIIFGLLYLVSLRVFRKHRRSKIFKTPATPELKKIAAEEIALFSYIPKCFREELLAKARIIMLEKNWEGCGGLALTNRMKISVSVQAAILLLNRKTRYFPVVDSILIYPSAYRGKSQSSIGYNIPEEQIRLGESWSKGTVVLAWDAASLQARDLSLGQNVVLHEFAHQLDQEDGRGDGTPVLKKWSSYRHWAQILGREYAMLREKTMHHEKDVIDAYGATNPAEFFAVATEAFFDKSQRMKKNHPELYEEFKEYYRIDPASWYYTE
jgi:hypothetical protein